MLSYAQSYQNANLSVTNYSFPLNGHRQKNPDPKFKVFVNCFASNSYLDKNIKHMPIMLKKKLQK